MQTCHIGGLQWHGPDRDAALTEGSNAFRAFAAHALRKTQRGVVQPCTQRTGMGTVR